MNSDYREQGGRAAAAWLARSRFGYPAGQTGRALGYAGPSSVTRAVRRMEGDRPRLSGPLDKIERKLARKA